MRFQKRRVWQFSKEGVFIKEYESLTDAGKKYMLSTSNIHKAIKRNTKCGGYYWRYAIGERPLHIPIERFRKGKKVDVYIKKEIVNGHGERIKVEKGYLLTSCKCITEASKLMKVSKTGIRRNCKGEIKFLNKYIFMFAEN